MNDTTDAAGILAPLWRRKWVILAVALLVAAGTYLYYKGQTPVYEASTQLYLGSGSEQQNALSTSSSSKGAFSGRSLADQVGIINSPIIAQPVRKKLHVEGDIAGAKGKVKAQAAGTSDFITIKTEASTVRGAEALANGFAKTYILRQHLNYQRALRAAIANTHAQLRRLEAAPSKGKHASAGADTIQIVNLNSKLNQLESQLSVNGVQQVAPAKANPLPLSPKPKSNAIFGFVLGFALACIAVFILSRTDRRQRNLSAVEHTFQTQVLTAIPEVKRPITDVDGVRGPARSLVEPMRRLYTALQIAEAPVAGAPAVEQERPGQRRRVILFLSAEAGDGKSTVIANLARVQSESGERVVVVEADFRRPVQARLLGVEGSRGLADVLGGRLTTAEAMQQAAGPERQAQVAEVGDGASASTLVAAASAGTLSVLIGGDEGSASPPALLGGEAMGELLRTLPEEYDHVLIDAPPPLEVSDVMPLLPKVDAIVIVARVGHTRDVAADRLMELLSRTPTASVLGVVVNCVQRKDLERSGFAWVSTGRRQGPKRRRR